MEKFLSFMFFQQPKIPFFPNRETLKSHSSFFQFVYSRFANARGPSLLEWALFVSAELFVPLNWTRNMKTILSFVIFFSSQISPFSKPTTLKRHYSFFNSSTVELPTLEVQTCWGEPLLLVLNVLYHCGWLETWKNKFCPWFFIPPKKTTFLTLRPWNSKFFFQFVYRRFANARGPSLLEWAIFVFLWVRNFLYHYTGLGTWKSFFQLWFFQQAKIPFSNPKTLTLFFSIPLQ